MLGLRDAGVVASVTTVVLIDVVFTVEDVAAVVAIVVFLDVVLNVEGVASFNVNEDGAAVGCTT